MKKMLVIIIDLLWKGTFFCFTYIYFDLFYFSFFQACRTGLVQHLEHLMFFGADMDVVNASGNTPLHICAVNNMVRP